MIKEFKVDENNNIGINLRENILLEASAGTGKTYSLERVVLNLIKNETYGLTLKDILVVTFTNKATREMKERIRKILISEYRNEVNPKTRHRLEVAIGDFDEASIFTIHGFCQNTLQSFPFESLSLFDQEINQDTTLLEGAVWDFLRDLEKADDDKALEEYYSFRGNKSFTSVVDELIKLYNREEFKGDCLYFPSDSDSSEIYKIKDEFDRGNGVLYNLIKVFKNYNATMLHEASKAMSCATRITSFDKVALGFGEIDLEKGFYAFMERLYSDGFCENLVKLTSTFLEGKSKKQLLVAELDITSKEIILNTDELLVFLEPLFDINNLKNNPIDRFLSGEFIKKSLVGIDNFFKKRQESMGSLSYNDLIDNLHNRIMDTTDDSLLNALRHKYKIALIDEFQDTDKKQWDIFNRIFGQSERHNFLLIGDPKQSIYGFRGADLEIYYKAKESVLEDNRYYLGTNFRSEDGIIQGVNKIYQSVFDVKTKGNTVSTSFLPVKSPGKSKRLIGDSDHNIEFLYFDKEVEEGKTLSSSDCKKGYFQTIINKILLLLNTKENSILPGEIVILVENHKDSIFLRDRLLKKSVPVVISKQKNVYKSLEAYDILALLKALNRPGGMSEIKTLLFSPLFAYDQKEIHKMELNGELEVISSKLLTWREQLLHSGIITVWNEVESYSKKGHLQTRLLKTINGERAYTNYKHLIENLDIMQKNERLNTLSLYQKLHNLMENSQEDEENSVRLDRDSQAVQIMTIHASKGLEFPVVFFAGGFSGSRSRPDSYGFKYAEKGGLWTVDFLSRGSSKLLAERDEWEEKKRLYYVAFTRAGSKLYLPIFPNGDLMAISSLYASLNWDETKMLIEDRAGDSLDMCEQPIHKQLKIGNTKISKDIKSSLSKKIYEDISGLFYIDKETYLSTQENYSITSTSSELLFDKLKTSKGFRDRVTWVSSYSALTKDTHGSTSKEDADREDDDEVITPEYKKSGELNTFNIPGGATFGDFVHEFFEEIEFEKYKLTLQEFLKDEDVHFLTLNGAKKHFDLDWINKYGQVAKTIIWNTLNSKLNLNGELTPVGSFGHENRIHEREFYFRVDNHKTINSHNLELKVEEGYIKGFIDLIINHNGCLYIADWKSTTIKGEESYDNYSADRVEKSMNEHSYHLQGLIYTVALYLHLHRTKKDFNYDKDIGGYLYLYVRGMGPETQSGVSFRKPPENEVLSFIKELRGDL